MLNNIERGMSKRVPEILIIGTMRGGTTALWTALTNLPNICMGITKEIHYFTLHVERPLRWYIDQFPDRRNEIIAVDASPTYFDIAYTTEIPERIRAAIPECCLILCVRDPVERAISHYFQLQRSERTGPVFRNIGINQFFERALKGEDHPNDELLSHIKYAIEFSIYDTKYENYLRVFGDSRVLVLENDEIVHNMNAVMNKVLSHCRLPPAAVNFNKNKYIFGSRTEELDESIRRDLSKRLYPPYDRFRRLAGLPATGKG